MVLDKIKKENDIQEIPMEEMPQLAEEIRQFLIQSISETGGHLASNLGVVELTMALHRSFHLPNQSILKYLLRSLQPYYILLFYFLKLLILVKL